MPDSKDGCSCRFDRGAVEPRVGFSSYLQAQRTDALSDLDGHRLPSNHSCQSRVSKTHRSIFISATIVKKCENESGLSRALFLSVCPLL